MAGKCEPTYHPLCIPSPSQTNFAKLVMAATMTTMHDDDADEYDELSSTFADEMSIPKTIRKRLLYNPGRKGRFVVG